MLNIVVVDDEAPIRAWLEYCIKKHTDFSVLTAANGEEAYRTIIDTKPNVVFTDIRMPGMDGLELMRRVVETLPFTTFILLTNYADFSYAKQAISLGAHEYLLKSELRATDIERILNDISARVACIRAEKIHDTLKDGLVDLYDMYHNHERADFTAAFWSRQGLRDALPYLTVCVANDKSAALRNQLAQLAVEAKADFSVAAVETAYLYLILQCRDLAALEQSAAAASRALADRGLSVGISTVCTATERFIQVAAESAACVESCFFAGPGVVRYEHLSGLPPMDRAAVLQRTRAILLQLSGRRAEAALESLPAWFDLFRAVNADDVKWAIDHIRRMVLSVEERYFQIAPPPAAGWDVQNTAGACRAWCLTMLTRILNQRQSRRSRSIETAIGYIHAHYAEPISMAEVARQLYCSPEHFSRQFKEGAGENFSVYLTLYRLDRAQELLQETSLPVFQIAAKVGYGSPSYFSRLYRKYKGISPEEERRGTSNMR